MEYWSRHDVASARVSWSHPTDVLAAWQRSGRQAAWFEHDQRWPETPPPPRLRREEPPALSRHVGLLLNAEREPPGSWDVVVATRRDPDRDGEAPSPETGAKPPDPVGVTQYADEDSPAGGAVPAPKGAAASASGASHACTLPPGAVLLRGGLLAGKYRLERPLAEGGMGTVWLGRNEELELDVAIKVIRSDREAPQLGARLLNEARAAARLRHPGIVKILDYGTTDSGAPYLVMERLTGLTLHEHLDVYGRLEPEAAVSLLLPAAAALDAAHRKNVVHRDFKPENLILAEGDDHRVEPKVVDFGVAKPVTPSTTRLTVDGGVVGSPHYLSPEQAMGLDVDHRSDIWSFAVVLYETLSGRLPFTNGNYHALLQSIIHAAPQPLNADGLADDALWGILERGLAKSADERWQSMHEFGTALARWLLERNVVADASGRSISATWFRKPELIGHTTGGGGKAQTTTTPPTRSSRMKIRVEPAGMPRRRRGIGLAAGAGLVACIAGVGLSVWLQKGEQGGTLRGSDARPASAGEARPNDGHRAMSAKGSKAKPASTPPAPPAVATSLKVEAEGNAPLAAPTASENPAAPLAAAPSSRQPRMRGSSPHVGGPPNAASTNMGTTSPQSATADTAPAPSATGTLELKTEF